MDSVGVMARLNRVSPIGIAQHVIQRGNNRQICFGDDGAKGVKALLCA
jgi:putative transposase